MVNDTKVSIIIPAFNSARYLPEAIDSILAQDYKNVEVIVVDDGSTDGTGEVVRRYGTTVKYLRLETNSGGPAKPRNVGIRAASGGYVAIFDADDVMMRSKLREQMEFLLTHPAIPLVFSNFRNFSEEGDAAADFLADHGAFHAMKKVHLRKNWYRLPADQAYETLIGDNFVGTSGIVMRRSLVDEVGYFDESVCNSDDIEFLFRVTRRYDLGYIAAVLHRRRLHGGNISGRMAALHSKLAVYGKQREVSMSVSARARLDQFLAGVLFSIGHTARVNGQKGTAVKYYVDSWRTRPNARIVLSIFRALLPR